MKVKQPEEIIKSNLDREFKNNLDKFNGKVHGLKRNLVDNGRNFTNEHFSRSRNNLYLRIENIKQELDKSCDEMLEKLNQSESERIKFLGI